MKYILLNLANLYEALRARAPRAHSFWTELRGGGESSGIARPLVGESQPSSSRAKNSLAL
jgi:hypothetical protein